MEPLSDRPWFVVKVVLFVVLGILVVIFALDGISILRARSHLADAAKAAATAGATSYHTDHSATKACDAAQASIKSADSAAVIGKHFCKVDTAGGTVTITLRQDAGTILVGKLPFVRRLALLHERTTSTGA